jgi:hypothetical protein
MSRTELLPQVGSLQLEPTLSIGKEGMACEESTRLRTFYSVRRPRFRSSRFVCNASVLRRVFGHDLAPLLVDGITISWSETMKCTSLKNFRAASLALSLALGSAQLAPVLLGQAQSQDPNAGQEQKSQTFVGKIVKAKNGQFALLTDEQAGKGVYLDNQEKAKEFEGKSVKVIGVLEAAKNLVHVTDIVPA